MNVYHAIANNVCDVATNYRIAKNEEWIYVYMFSCLAMIQIEMQYHTNCYTRNDSPLDKK